MRRVSLMRDWLIQILRELEAHGAEFRAM